MSEIVEVIIANGQSLSGAADLREGYVVEIVMPGAWTAADLTFQVSDDNSTFKDVYDTAGELAITTADVNRRIKLSPDDLLGACYLKVRSGTSGTPVAQAAERVIGLKIRKIV
jgi:hypothetical protein